MGPISDSFEYPWARTLESIVQLMVIVQTFQTQNGWLYHGLWGGGRRLHWGKKRSPPCLIISAISPFLHIIFFLSPYFVSLCHIFGHFPSHFSSFPLSPTHVSSPLHQVEVDSDGTVSLSSIATQFTGNIITHHTEPVFFHQVVNK